ncbi:MAG: hypothetical protein IKO61_05195 [Lachnospiraceae bacterium]|nr:hypothetical protein [Lachnospiraceae bacterium]
MVYSEDESFDKRFCVERKIFYSDFDASGNMRLSRLGNFFQECINAHSQAINRGIDYCVSTGRTWYVIAWNIEIKKLPKMYDKVKLYTWGYAYKRSLGQRNVIMKDENGETLAVGDSLWSLMDINKGTPLRIEDSDMEGYVIYPRSEEMTYMGRHIELDGAFDLIDQIRTRKWMIDYNGHVSNDSFIAIASEYIPEDVSVSRIRAEYRAQAKYGELLKAYMSVTGDNTHIIKLCGEAEEDVRCVVSFSVD